MTSLRAPIRTAVQHVRRMRGGTQPHLMRCDDGHYYVVKFQNNPQHVRVLVNELLATRLARLVGLPVPEPQIVWVGAWIVERTPDLVINHPGSNEPCMAGLHFGSRYVASTTPGTVFDYLPESLLNRIHNIDTFAGILSFDKWTSNTDNRQVLFCREARQRKFRATFIDQGYCFNAARWNFPDFPLLGAYVHTTVYKGVHSWNAFQPWLGRIAQVKREAIAECAQGVPPEWCSGSDLKQLLDQLYVRRERVRELIDQFRASSPTAFRNWAEASQHQSKAIGLENNSSTPTSAV